MTSLDTPRDIASGLAGVGGMAFDLLTPFLRSYRSHWGLAAEEAKASFVGDYHVARPSWLWTHAIEVRAPAERVWPWIAQIGQGKAGFYSYQWLENLLSCQIQNADRIHPEWLVSGLGEELRIHPKAPPLIVSDFQAGRLFVVTSSDAPQGGTAARDGDPTIQRLQASWLFSVEPLRGGRSRVVSRYRVAHGLDWRSRLQFGSFLLEPIGFTMDRRMLIGIKERAERA